MEMLDRTERLKNRLIQILREIEEAEDALEDTSTPDNVKHFYQGQLTEWRENYYNLQRKLQAS